jgi:hypothetical protein
MGGGVQVGRIPFRALLGCDYTYRPPAHNGGACKGCA